MLRQAELPEGYREFRTVQALRGVAAMLVVIYHSLGMWAERIASPANPKYWSNGAAGVDIFFVISGFVMFLSSRRLVGERDGWRIFVRHRLLRIVPLYWLITTVKLLSVLVLPSMALHGFPPLYNIICSYLFIPSRTLSGDIRLVVPDGWTLCFEMLFYALFAGALALRIPVWRMIIPAFFMLTFIAPFRTDSWPGFTLFASDLVLEFIPGIVIGEMVLRGLAFSRRSSIMLLGSAFIAILTLPIGPELGYAHGFGAVTPRVLTYGIPAAIIVATALSLEFHVTGLLPRWLLVLGDASYSIYLLHSLVLPVVGAAIIRLHLPQVYSEFSAVVLGGLASAIAGVLMYYCVERPMTNCLRSALTRRFAY